MDLRYVGYKHKLPKGFLRVVRVSLALSPQSFYLSVLFTCLVLPQ